jgi:hypothetical protein
LNSNQYFTKIIDRWIANKQKCQSCGLIIMNLKKYQFQILKIGENKINLKKCLQNFCKDMPELYSGRYNASVVVYLPPLFPCLLSLFPVSVFSAPALFLGIGNMWSGNAVFAVVSFGFPPHPSSFSLHR